ncbi:protein rolling stone-like [Dendronephthya gigantea]|uniref:protein rolling stone-like n=1 Tax=Dendronephthya gigantea TaxID=151771 RepID=UPI00106A819C|nr:protein rolling stone-like [Dendronephthya gigantea]
MSQSVLLEMWNTLKNEFSIEKLPLQLNRGDSIYESWVLPRWGLLLLRLLISTFCIIIIVVSVARWPEPRWLIYLTNWSYLLLTITMIGLTLVSIFHVFKRKQALYGNSPGAYEMKDTQIAINQMIDQIDQIGDSESTMPLERDDVALSLIWYEKIVLFLWVISANAGLLVTIEYWILVFRPPTSFMDISVHALNSVFILTELFTANTSVRVLHWIYVLLFSIIYAAFTVIYWAAGGVNSRGEPFIYHILDYENGKPGSIAAVLICSLFIVAPLIQIILYGFYRIKLLLNKKRNGDNNNVVT